MLLLVCVICILILVAAFDYARGFPVQVTARAGGGEGLRVVARALAPFVKVEVNAHGGVPFLVLYIFNIKVYNAFLRLSGHAGGRFNGRKFLGSAELSEITVAGSFGLMNPYETGVAWATLGAAEAFVPAFAKVESFELIPDFLAESGYFRLNAHARFSLSHTIINYMKRRT